MPDGGGLVAALRAALPAGIAVAVEDPEAGSCGLLLGEALDYALPKRLAEFAAGRRAARAAMAMLGFAPVAIPHGPDRSPWWPKRVVGSISHTDGLCVAVVGRADDWIGMGLDLEPDRALEAALWPEILRPTERGCIDDLPETSQGFAAMAFFVAKEAVYKAQYPTSRTLIDFQAISVEMDDHGFVARFETDLPGFSIGTTVAGQFCRADGYIAAFSAIRQAAVA